MEHLLVIWLVSYLVKNKKYINIIKYSYNNLFFIINYNVIKIYSIKIKLIK